MSPLTIVVSYLPYWIVGTILLIAIILLYLFWILRKLRKAEAPQAEAAPGGESPGTGMEKPPSRVTPPRPLELRISFSRAVRFLRANVAGRNYRYQIPWYLLLGETESGKTSLIRHVRVEKSSGAREHDFGIVRGPGWHFFDQGVVLDVPGDYLVRPGTLGSDEKSWRRLLRLLNGHRPRRPIDGIILTLPATDFQSSTGLDQASLGRKAGHLYQRLWHAQKALGMCFPIYVVVTKCDQLPGFRTLCHALPDRCRQEMFGWSSPYGLGVAFTPQWIDEAFEYAVGALIQARSEIFAGRQRVEDPDALYFFPGELLSLQDSLRFFLHQLFRQTVYRESFHFRGLYFCGDAGLATAEPVEIALLEAAPDDQALPSPGQAIVATPIGIEERAPAPVFLDDLFGKKIFPEWGIARPYSRIFSFRRGAMITVQNLALAAILILGLGLGFGYHRLSVFKRQELLPMLQLINDDLSDLRVTQTTGLHVRRDAYHIVESVANLSSRTFSSAFIPSSWFSSIDNRIQAAVETAFREEVLQTLLTTLEFRARRIGQSGGSASLEAGQGSAVPTPNTTLNSAANTTTSNPVSVEELPEFGKLDRFNKAVVALEENIARYQDIAKPGHGTLAELSALMKYVDPQSAYEITAGGQTVLYRALLRVQGPPFPQQLLDTTRQSASTEMSQLVESLFNAWFGQNVVLTTVNDLQSKIGKLDRPSNLDYQALKDLQDSLEEAERVLKSPDVTWVAGEGPDLRGGALYTVTLEPVRQSASSQTPLLSPDLGTSIRQSAAVHFQSLRAKLGMAQTDITGPLLQFGPNTIQLSPTVEGLRVPIVNLLALPFMVSQPVGNLRIQPASGTRVIWDQGPLEQAVVMCDSYNRFVKEGLLAAPADVRDAFRRIALNQLEPNVLDQIGQAENFTSSGASEAGTTADQTETSEVKSFQAAQPLLNEILANLARLGLNTPRAELLKLTRAQASRLLQELDQKLSSQQVYTVKNGNFDWWNGQTAPTLAAFDVRSPDDLTAYLSFERQQMQSWAAEAGALIDFLQSHPAGLSSAQSRLVQKWQGIIAAMQKYNDKIPGNSVASLEDFISSSMNKVTPDDYCQAGVAPAGGASHVDYFVQARDNLRRSLYSRCVQLANAAAYRNYTALADLFNQTLAGRFPFGSTGAQTEFEATPDALLAFFQLLDEYDKSLQQAFEQTTAFGDSAKTALTFLKQAEALRPIFASFLANQQQQPVPVFDFLPAFRVNQAREVSGNQIISWMMQVGTQSFRFGQPAQTGRWSLGDRVRVELRWAKDSAYLPFLQGGGSGVTVTDHTVIFTYNDPWSLFNLLINQEAPPEDFDRFVDPNPSTLAFNIPTTRDFASLQKPSPQAQAVTKVFIRVTLMPPGKTDVLRLTPFPRSAPQLTEKTGTQQE
jgi:type VI secretion system protein ImpL